MDDFCLFDAKTSREIRDLLRSIDQKLGVIVEQNRTERQVFFKSFGDEDDERA